MSKKQPDIRDPDFATIPSEVDVWIRTFVTFFEMYVIQNARDLPQNSAVAELRIAAAKAVFQTFLESGMDRNEVLVLLGDCAGADTIYPESWNEKLNQRRLELIDKDIQQALPPAESFELARLTKVMREHVESELNLPIKGAQELHRRLLQPGSTDVPE